MARDQPAPAPDIALVVIAERPLILRDLLDCHQLLTLAPPQVRAQARWLKSVFRTGPPCDEMIE
jgi:hypothetical protein